CRPPAHRGDLECRNPPHHGSSSAADHRCLGARVLSGLSAPPPGLHRGISGTPRQLGVCQPKSAGGVRRTPSACARDAARAPPCPPSLRSNLMSLPTEWTSAILF